MDSNFFQKGGSEKLLVDEKAFIIEDILKTHAESELKKAKGLNPAMVKLVELKNGDYVTATFWLRNAGKIIGGRPLVEAQDKIQGIKNDVWWGIQPNDQLEHEELSALMTQSFKTIEAANLAFLKMKEAFDSYIESNPSEETVKEYADRTTGTLENL
jgi:hypothetical protein